jgi:hypothetical protein
MMEQDGAFKGEDVGFAFSSMPCARLRARCW